jgi:membrane protein implicated in regulation of membrane protease activity
MGTNMLIAWIVLLIVLVVVEASTAQLVTIWFAFGSFVALMANLFHASVWLQITLFVVVSLVSLAATRPLVKKFTKRSRTPTNADMVIGKSALVVEEINNSLATGLVKVNGVTWTARSSDNSVIPKEATVSVEKIEGVKLIVSVNNT